MPENNIRSVKQNPFTPPAASPTELTTYIGTPPTHRQISPELSAPVTVLVAVALAYNRETRTALLER